MSEAELFALLLGIMRGAVLVLCIVGVVGLIGIFAAAAIDIWRHK